MVFRILDSSAFYAGIPFGSLKESYTTSLIYDEVKHIKKNHGAIELLLETGRVRIMDPSLDNLNIVIKEARKTGDFAKLSKEDISVVALCLQLKGELVTDDFSVSNVARNLDLSVFPIMTNGIKDVGNWILYCPGCHKKFSGGSECPLCGNPLKRKLLKQNSEVNFSK